MICVASVSTCSLYYWLLALNSVYYGLRLEPNARPANNVDYVRGCIVLTIYVVHKA